MIILILTIMLLITGIILNIFNESEWSMLLGIFLDLVAVIAITIDLSLLAVKPANYKYFKIKYDTIQEMQTSSEDVRDATYTQNLIEINEEIKINREYVDNIWIGIFYNKDIANLELLNK
jgi:hypothetical protein